jgi:hypothetical protein
VPSSAHRVHHASSTSGTRSARAPVAGAALVAEDPGAAAAARPALERLEHVVGFRSIRSSRVARRASRSRRNVAESSRSRTRWNSFSLPLALARVCPRSKSSRASTPLGALKRALRCHRRSAAAPGCAAVGPGVAAAARPAPERLDLVVGFGSILWCRVARPAPAATSPGAAVAAPLAPEVVRLASRAPSRARRSAWALARGGNSALAAPPLLARLSAFFHRPRPRRGVLREVPRCPLRVRRSPSKTAC